MNCPNACCSHALWFTASRVIVTSSHVPKSKHISHRNILAAYQNPLKDSCCVYDGVSRLLASGFKEAPQNKGRWRMTWPSSAVWNHSQVTCVFVHPLHLEVLENGVDSTQRCKEPSYRPPCHSRCVLSSFFFFFRSAVVVMISTLTEGLRMIPACCCLGTKWQCLVLFFLDLEDISWKSSPLAVGWNHLALLLTTSWQATPLWPDFSFFTPTSICAYCQIKIGQFIILTLQQGRAPMLLFGSEWAVPRGEYTVTASRSNALPFLNPL